MLCGMYLYANSEQEAEKVGKEILSGLDDLISDITVVANVEYWKRKEVRVVDFNVILKVNENEVRQSKEWINFLNSISDKWESLGHPFKNHFIISEMFPHIKYIKKSVAMIDIFIGNEI